MSKPPARSLIATLGPFSVDQSFKRAFLLNSSRVNALFWSAVNHIPEMTYKVMDQGYGIDQVFIHSLGQRGRFPYRSSLTFSSSYPLAIGHQIIGYGSTY